MHVPDGFVVGWVNAAAAVTAVTACGVAVNQARRTHDEREVTRLGMTAAFVFAAQMLNFPIFGGTSGHFLGAFLAALLLGPARGLLVMALVLTLQCLMFADGGLTALGTNILNMGLVGGVLSYGAFLVLRACLPSSRRGFLAAVAVAAWLSVVLTAAACAAELASSDRAPFALIMTAMIGVHTVIGVGEALITTATVAAVLAARPDLIAAGPDGLATRSGPQSTPENRPTQPRPTAAGRYSVSLRR